MLHRKDAHAFLYGADLSKTPQLVFVEVQALIALSDSGVCS